MYSKTVTWVGGTVGVLGPRDPSFPPNTSIGGNEFPGTTCTECANCCVGGRRPTAPHNNTLVAVLATIATTT